MALSVSPLILEICLKSSNCPTVLQNFHLLPAIKMWQHKFATDRLRYSNFVIELLSKGKSEGAPA
jgi:hypothetical protein